MNDALQLLCSLDHKTDKLDLLLTDLAGSFKRIEANLGELSNLLREAEVWQIILSL